MIPKRRRENLYVFANSYKPVLGGVQTVAAQFAEGCVERGYRTTVVANLYPRRLKFREKIGGVPVLRLPFGIPEGCSRNTLMFLFSATALFFLFLFRRPDYVFVHFPLSQSSCVTTLRRVFGFKIISCFHGHDVLRYDEGYSKASAQYLAQKELVDQSAYVTACSGFLARRVKDAFGCPSVQTVYNGVDLGRFGSCHPRPAGYGGTPYLFAWGRLEQIKGFDLLIQAFTRCRKPRELKLLIAGEGTQRERLHRMIGELGQEDSILLIGRLSPDGIVRYAQNSEINVIPSLRESFGIVALEAIAAGRPIISTNGGGLPEVMSEKYGFIVPANADEIRKAIDRILSGDAEFDFSDTREYLSSFTVPRMVDNYISLIK